MGRADALKLGRRKDGHLPLARSELPIDTVSLARHLIGKVLVRELPEGVASGLIVETEAYVLGPIWDLWRDRYLAHQLACYQAASNGVRGANRAACRLFFDLLQDL